MSSERSGPIAGVVLAAGNSTRMGRNKLLLELDGEPVIRRAVGRALDAGLSPIIVVMGFEADRVRGALSGLTHHEVINTDFEAGINSSVRLGIAAVPDQAIAAVVMLPDMPFVTTSMLETLMARYRESEAPLVISRYGDVNAPPMLHGRLLFPEFDRPDGEGCGKHVVRRHRDDAVVVECDPAALADLDVPEDYERVKVELTA